MFYLTVSRPCITSSKGHRSSLSRNALTHYRNCHTHRHPLKLEINAKVLIRGFNAYDITAKKGGVTVDQRLGST